jgi:hypothetical protein
LRKRKRKKRPIDQGLIQQLDSNLRNMAARLEKLRIAEFAEATQRPLRLLWLNFVSGLARGVGMVVGAAFMTAIGLAVLYGVLYWLLHYLKMIPLVNELLQKLSGLFQQFVQNGPGSP